jgi:hypothetical protein
VAAPPPEPPLPTSRERSPERPATELPVDNFALPLPSEYASPVEMRASPDRKLDIGVVAEMEPEESTSPAPDVKRRLPPRLARLAPAAIVTSPPSRNEPPTARAIPPAEEAGELPVESSTAPLRPRAPPAAVRALKLPLSSPRLAPV